MDDPLLPQLSFPDHLALGKEVIVFFLPQFPSLGGVRVESQEGDF